MFGYFKPARDELKVCEDKYYRSLYCGLCQAIKMRCSRLARLVTSYDMVMLAALFAATDQKPPELKRIFCPLHPGSNRIAAFSPAIDAVADINVLLAYHKLDDDWRDERSIKALACKALLLSGYRRAACNSSKACEIIKTGIRALGIKERKMCCVPDEVADEFSSIVERLLAETYDAQGPRLAWAELGRHLGRWVYLIDAYDDIPKDQRDGSYNPFLVCYGANAGQAAREALEIGLSIALDEAAKAMELLPIKRDKGLIDNFFYIGLYNEMNRVMERI